MEQADVVIVGGGMVGLTLAALLADSPLAVVVVEQGPPPAGEPQLERVSALNHASQTLLQRLGLWPLAAAYARTIDLMQVWQADAPGRLSFTPQLAESQDLGCIVSNEALVQALWQRLQRSANVQLWSHARPQQFSVGKRDGFLQLDDGRALSASLLVAADGAESWLRQQAGLPQCYADYGHDALVARVHCAKPHGGMAIQVFHRDGPLALLPLADEQQLSLVWSQPPAAADARMALDEHAFGQALTAASDNIFGPLTLLAERQRFSLRWRYSRHWLAEHLVVIGDAAHTIHPLAGQGVNLGLMDAAVLAEQLLALQANGQPLDQRAALRSFERWRKADALALSAAMAALRGVFAVPQPLRLLVGAGMSLVDGNTGLKRQLLHHALWGPGRLPALATP